MRANICIVLLVDESPIIIGESTQYKTQLWALSIPNWYVDRNGIRPTRFHQNFNRMIEEALSTKARYEAHDLYAICGVETSRFTYHQLSTSSSDCSPIIPGFHHIEGVFINLFFHAVLRRSQSGGAPNVLSCSHSYRKTICTFVSCFIEAKTNQTRFRLLFHVY